MRIRAPAVNCF